INTEAIGPLPLHLLGAAVDYAAIRGRNLKCWVTIHLTNREVDSAGSCDRPELRAIKIVGRKQCRTTNHDVLITVAIDIGDAEPTNVADAHLQRTQLSSRRLVPDLDAPKLGGDEDLWASGWINIRDNHAHDRVG